MKLKQPLRERTSRVAAAEVLLPAQKTPQFDLMRDVPPETWEGVTKKVENLISNSRAGGLIEDLGILSQINPVVRDQLRQRVEFVTALKQAAHQQWDRRATFDTRQLKGSIQMLGDCLSILPELRDELGLISDEQLQAVLSFLKEEMISGKGKDYMADTEIPFRFSAGSLMAIFRLLPNKRTLVRGVLDDEEFKKGLDTRINNELAKGVDWNSFLVLADASLLYPDRADWYKQQAAAYWGAVKQEIAISGPKFNLMIKPSYLLWAAKVLAADRAFIDHNGDLHCEYSRPIMETTELPPRLVG